MNSDASSVQKPKAQNAPSPTQLVTSPSPWLAAALSFFLPGAGQALNGRFWKGVLLLILSFVSLPALSLSLAHLGVITSLVILLPLLAPWLYSIVDAAREAIRLERTRAGFNPAKGAIYVTILLVLVFPIVALVFSIITLLILPEDVLVRIANWSEGFRRASGLGG